MISQKKANPIYNALAVFLLVSASVLFIGGPMIPKAHAANPALDIAATGGACTCNSLLIPNSATFTPSAINELIVLTFNEQDLSVSSCAGFIKITSIVDASAGSWTEVGGAPQCVNRDASNVGVVDIWYAFITAAVGQTVQIFLSASVNQAWGTISVYTNTQGYIVLDHESGSCNTLGSCTTSVTTTGSTSYTIGDILIGDTMTRGGVMSAAGAGYTALNYYTGSVSTGSCSGGTNPPMCYEYQIPGGSGSTNYPSTVAAGGNPWVVEGVDFGNPTVVYSVVACSFFQLQCWWYPMLMFGVGMAPFALVGALGKVNARGMTYLMLFGLTMTSLVEVLMGLINIMLPLGLTVLTILYLVRIRI